MISFSSPCFMPADYSVVSSLLVAMRWLGVANGARFLRLRLLE